MDDFIVRAALGGIGVAAVAGPLGAFVVWRRMAYFGDSLAHSALLGVALGLLLGTSLNLSIIAVCLAAAILLVLLQQQRYLATDTLLGILAHGSLSLGLVAIAFLETVRFDLLSLLFGDVLAISVRELRWIYLAGALSLAMLAVIWRPLLAITVHEDLARVEGVPVLPVRLAFMLLIAIVIAFALKVVGIILITSLLIIPAAAARRLSRTPEQMAVMAAILGSVAVLGGLWGSWSWDTPSGPSIVVAAVVLFVLSLAAPVLRRSRG
ncbi:MAG: metal ABC transporter permease [Alphaproteobacteria bacterium]